MSKCDDVVLDEGQVNICPAEPEFYGQAAMDFLLHGPAWPREEGTNMHSLYYKAVGGLFTQVHNRICEIMAEGFPCTANEALDEWALALGLPDDCDDPALRALCDTADAEGLTWREQICARAAAAFGGAGDIVELAALFGLTIEAVEIGGRHNSMRHANRAVCRANTHSSEPQATTGRHDLFAHGLDRHGDTNGVSRAEHTRHGQARHGRIVHDSGRWRAPAYPQGWWRGVSRVFRVTALPKTLLFRHGCAQHGGRHHTRPGVTAFFCLAARFKPAHVRLCFID